MGIPYSTVVDGNGLIVIPSLKGDAYYYDTMFRLVDRKQVNMDLSIQRNMDIDIDGIEEILVYDYNKSTLAIFRKGLKHPALINIPIKNLDRSSFSLRKNGENPPHLCLDADDMVYFISYQYSVLYYLKWLIYLGIYLGVLLFVWLIMKIQRSQLEKRFNTEKKVTELQMKLVRNQLDPHFTYNTINAIGASVLEDKPKEAYKNILLLAKLMRFGVEHSDKLSRTLKEEVEFVRSYLDLMKDRVVSGFEYSVNLDPAVNLSTPVPKMILQIYVENAIKHGIRHLESGGEIKISASRHEETLQLVIEDNGVGRKIASSKGSDGTGMGSGIMDQYYDLYFKVTNVKVVAEVVDLTHPDGQPSGTKVVINIS